MVGVAGSAVSHHFSVNLRAAFLGRFQRFEQQQSRAFANDKTVTVGVKGARSLGGLIVVLGRKGLEGRKARHAKGRDRGFDAAGDNGRGPCRAKAR